MHAIKSLVYFDDVEEADGPVIISEPGLKWEDIKNSIQRSCLSYSRNMFK